GDLSGPPSSGAPSGTNHAGAASQPQDPAVPATAPTAGPSRAPHTSNPNATERKAAPRTAAPATAHPAASQHPAVPGPTTHPVLPPQPPRSTPPQPPPRRTPTRPGTAGGAAIPGLPAIDTSTQVSALRQAAASAPAAAAHLDAYQ